MPRSLRRTKRRVDAYSGAEAWSDYFQFGFAMFDDFAVETGVAVDSANHVPEATAWAAWQAFGPAFIALNGRETERGEPHWALKQFGEPCHAR